MKGAISRFAVFTVLFFWATLGLSIAQEQQPNTPPATAPFAGATVSDWKGNVHVSLPGQPSAPPARGELLPPSTLLETENGRLLLQLADGSQVLVRERTRLKVQQPSPTERGYFHLLLGSIRSLIMKRTGGAPPFELGTPSAVIAVRGTKFDVSVDKKNKTRVDVLEGVVEVFSRHSGTSVLVHAGFSTSVAADGQPEAPRSNNGQSHSESGESGMKDKGLARGRKP